MMCSVQLLCISPLGAQFTKMAANGSEKAFCVLTFHDVGQLQLSSGNSARNSGRKDQIYVPPLPASIPELKVRIRTATETIIADMLQTVWNELDYHVNVCRITKSAHIEHL
jgi:hypothetical protein